MYGPLTKKSGVQAVAGCLNLFLTEDGLDLATPTKEYFPEQVAIAERLRDWLVDLRLLRRVPIAYLVPDAALLPPESIRFFHVDPTWVDRLVDGVFSAVNIGTLDSFFNYAMLALAREGIDEELLLRAQDQVPDTAWTPSQPLTGMLIRSELVRRWPDLIVRAYSGQKDDSQDSLPLPILRAEPITRDIYIALFAGEPEMVHLREPYFGVRYGVESRPEDEWTEDYPYKLDRRLNNGESAGSSILLEFHDLSRRILNLRDIGVQSTVENSPRQVALNLEQRAYVQELKQQHPEALGSVAIESFPKENGEHRVSFHHGRYMKLGALLARREQQETLKGEEP